jgi:DNA-binding phage protein
MTLEEIIAAFGGVSQAARALGVTRQTIYHWRRKGDIPEARRIQAEVIIARRTT